VAILRRVVRDVAFLVALLIGCVASLGCGDEKRLLTEPEGPPSESATFTRVQAEVFTPTCALSGCHLGPASLAQEGLVLSGDAYPNIVSVRANQNSSIFRVTPGDLPNSYLWRKISPGAGTIVGEPMPQTGSMSDAQRQLVRDWILRGAPRD
jgi:hypothetical protein